jgi:ABC-type glycerol-3-phosphate transport system permease component
MLISKVGLTDNLWAIILPYMTSPFAIFLMRQYFISIPDETIEAARIDGASEWQIYCRIALPQAKPALGAQGIFSFMFHWNNFTWPLIALTNHTNFTLPLGIAMMPGEYQTPYTELMAAATMVSIPILIVYFMLQNYFISGMVIKSSTGKGNT